MKPEDRRIIKDLGIATMLSGIIIIGAFFILSFIFFYGSPFTLVWSAILIMLRFRICEEGVEISLARVIQKYIKISITVTR